MRKFPYKVILASMIFLFLMQLVCPAFAGINQVFPTVTDVNNDGFVDLLFHLTDKTGSGIPNSQFSLYMASGVPIAYSHTNQTGYCTFYDMPAGDYYWQTSSGSPSSGFLTVPLEPTPSLTENETIVVQFLLFTWMGNSTEKTETFYENFSRYVGYDLDQHAFPSSAGVNLTTYSSELFQWFQGLEDCLASNITDSEVSRILQSLLSISKTVDLRTMENSENTTFDEADKVAFGVEGKYTNPDLINYTIDYYSQNVLLEEDNIALIPTENNNTLLALFGMLTSSLDSFISYTPFEQSTWQVQAQSDNLLVNFYFLIQEPDTIIGDISEGLDLAGSLKVLPKTLGGFSDVLDIASTFISNINLALGSYLILTQNYHSWTTYLNALSKGDLATLVLTGSIFIAGALIVAGIWATAAGFSAIGVGIAVGAVLFAFGEIVNLILDNVEYSKWLDELKGTLGRSLTKLLNTVQTLQTINTTDLRNAAQEGYQASDLLGQFAQASNNMKGFFSDSCSGLHDFWKKQNALADAIDETTQSLDKLIGEYLYWNGGSKGKVVAHLEGFNSTVAYYSDSQNFTNNAGIYDPSLGGYQEKIVTNNTLNPQPNIVASSTYPHWANQPFSENDTFENKYVVTYNIQSNTFSYNPQPRYMKQGTVTTVTKNGLLETSYQYKFFFDSETTKYGLGWQIDRYGMVNEDTINDWQSAINATYQQEVLPNIQNLQNAIQLLMPDTTPPQTQLYIANPISFSSGTAFLDSRTVFGLYSYDNQSSVSATYFRIFNNEYDTGWIPFASSTSPSYVFGLPADLPNGVYQFTYHSVDCAGNIEGTKSYGYYVSFVNGPFGVPVPVLYFVSSLAVERPVLAVQPANLVDIVQAGTDFTATIQISETSGFADLTNVTVACAGLVSSDHALIPYTWLSFDNNNFTVVKGQSVNTTATLSLPSTTPCGNYYGLIYVSSQDRVQSVMVNLTVLSNFAYVTFDQSGIDSGYTGTVVTVDGTNYATSDIPTSFIWDKSSTHSFAFRSPFTLGSNMKQYIWSSTNGLSSSKSGTITVPDSGNITGNYLTQYYLTVQTSPSGLNDTTGEGWYDANTYAAISASQSLMYGTSRYVFGGWTTTNMTEITNATSLATTVLVDTSKTVTANYSAIHDVAATDISTDRQWVYQGCTAYVNVTVWNKGDFIDNVNVALYYNVINNQTVGILNITLLSGQNETAVFAWNTKGVPYGLNYTMTAIAEIPADNNLTDNTLSGGTIRVRIFGDINDDNCTDMRDIGIAASAFGSQIGDPRWNPDCDMNQDGKINLRDIALIAKYFGQHIQ